MRRTALLDLAFPFGLAGLMIYLGFEAGGYFAGTTGWVAAGLACSLGLSAIIRRRPPRGITPSLLVAAAALALFAIWTLLSGEWSGATSRALLEFDRVLLYLLTLLLFASASRPEQTLNRLPAAVAFAAVILCGAGVLIRTLPDAWPFSLPPLSTGRLDYPVSYENALGAVAGLGLVFSLHLASSTQRLVATRVLAAGSLPVLAAALVLTFSRGAILVTVGALVAYLILGWSRGLLTAVIGAGPAATAAILGAYHADLLGTLRARTPAGLEQGEELALLLGLATLGAAVLLALLLPLERRLTRVSVRGAGRVALVGTVLLAMAAVALMIDAPSRVDSLGENFLESDDRSGERRARERLADRDLGGSNRIKYWQVGLDAFGDQPLRGHGAGSFARLWARDRPIPDDLTEGHSIYIEVLAELGVVGALALLVCLGTILVTLLGRLRGPSRPLYGAIVAATLLWLVHAGIDWDWEMPVLTMWLFALGGCALSVPGRTLRWARGPGWVLSSLVGVGCLLIALTPGTIALSQSRLDRSAAALRAGDCEQAQRSALDAISILAARPEPYAILAYCDARRGETKLAVDRMGQAIDRDPDNWELYYGLAIVRAYGGLDPRPAARTAHRLNPREERTIGALERFSTNRPRQWRRRAKSAPLPLYAEGAPG